MKNLKMTLGILALLIAMSCKEKKTDVEESVVEETNKEVKEEAPKSVSFILESKSESSATGKVGFLEIDGQVSMTAEFSGLTPGVHAVHIHEKSDCSSPDGKSTGGHWNPTLSKHGKWGDPDGYHRGDIGNIEADENGLATLTMQTEEWCIGCDDEKKNILGKAIIVHKGTDDFVTQPTGDAGGRVSCGGIIQ